jgi:hypothetical protein
MAKDKSNLPDAASPEAKVDAFIEQAKKAPASPRGSHGRLIFAMDATASRQPTWDRAAGIQGGMFQAAASLGGLEVQLAFFRGFGQFKVGPWTQKADDIARLMSSVFCLAGETQIVKVLQHTLNVAANERVNALVYVGDCMEEDVDKIGKLAGELGLIGLPVFVFHEGDDPIAAFAFEQMAKLSGGAYCRFDSNSPGLLHDLLAAVAAFAAGGRPALMEVAQKHGGEILKIARQVNKG